MFDKITDSMKKDIKQLKRKYRILKIKWILLFVLPVLIVVLAYQVTKQYLNLRLREIGNKRD